MKFNLRNRPILLDTRKSVEETLDWFEGFEKELRKILRDNIEDGCLSHHVRRRLAEEILGE